MRRDSTFLRMVTCAVFTLLLQPWTSLGTLLFWGSNPRATTCPLALLPDHTGLCPLRSGAPTHHSALASTLEMGVLLTSPAAGPHTLPYILPCILPYILPCILPYILPYILPRLPPRWKRCANDLQGAERKQVSSRRSCAAERLVLRRLRAAGVQGRAEAQLRTRTTTPDFVVDAAPREAVRGLPLPPPLRCLLTLPSLLPLGASSSSPPSSP